MIGLGAQSVAELHPGLVALAPALNQVSDRWGCGALGKSMGKILEIYGGLTTINGDLTTINGDFLVV